ncbi:MAG: extensin family protein, partial [Deltaproteobacteria bacterium]|nr:extensin family protein [Deltaproteobacteria bacterium]
GEGEGEVCDPAEAWEFVGASCDADGECPYDEGICLGPPEGFPCGHCSMPCDRLCPDQDGAPVTFCIDGGEIGIEPTGYCVSRCDRDRFPASGCRQGYACAGLPRYGEEGVQQTVCIPEDLVPDPEGCQAELAALGIDFEPSAPVVDRPDDHPDLTCEIPDPVFVNSPIRGIEFPEGGGGRLLMGCALARQVAVLADHLVEIGVVSFTDLGTYNCRVIAGTDTLSEHGNGLAIDLAAFTLEGGTTYTLEDDWIIDDSTPGTDGGQFLYDLAHWMYDESVFNIILTPDYNAAHRDHFHVDLTPGEHLLHHDLPPPWDADAFEI